MSESGYITPERGEPRLICTYNPLYIHATTDAHPTHPVVGEGINLGSPLLSSEISTRAPATEQGAGSGRVPLVSVSAEHGIGPPSRYAPQMVAYLTCDCDCRLGGCNSPYGEEIGLPGASFMMVAPWGTVSEPSSLPDRSLDDAGEGLTLIMYQALNVPGKALNIVKQVERGNGFEAWRRLWSEYRPNIAGRKVNLLERVMEDKPGPGEDFPS